MSCDLEYWTMIRASNLLDIYRRTGADLPFGDPRGHHGVAMEGYFWRLTDAGAGTVIVAFTGVSRDGDGASWATIGLAAHPGGFVRTVSEPRTQDVSQRRVVAA